MRVSCTDPRTSLAQALDNTGSKGGKVEYEEIVKHCELLSYRDKLRLAQLLIQLARKEEGEKTPESRKSTSDKTHTIEYVTERLLKSKPAKKPALLNFIAAMFQFQGGISEEDMESLVAELQRKKLITIDGKGHVDYRE